jgi:hypothetical protein
MRRSKRLHQPLSAQYSMEREARMRHSGAGGMGALEMFTFSGHSGEWKSADDLQMERGPT